MTLCGPLLTHWLPRVCLASATPHAIDCGAAFQRDRAMLKVAGRSRAQRLVVAKERLRLNADLLPGEKARPALFQPLRAGAQV